MISKAVVIIFFLGLLCGFTNFKGVYAQKLEVNSSNLARSPVKNFNQLPLKLKWGNNVKIGLADGTEKVYLFVENADYQSNEFGLPQIWLNYPSTITNEISDVKLINAEFEELVDLGGIEGLNTVKAEIKVDWSIGWHQKEPLLRMSFIPIINRDGKFMRLISGKLQIDFNPSKKMVKANNLRTTAPNSVLANGVWYKIGVTQDGIYKIDYKFLKSLGIDINALNPSNLKLYGKGGGMLPFKNSNFRFDDLPENAIYVEGENDGRFDTSDYILFYGQSPDRWIADPTSCLGFTMQRNSFSDTTFYFLNISPGLGKRVQTIAPPIGIPNKTVDQFDDLVSYEKDNVNLIKSGRKFYGELFEAVTSYNFDFKFPNLVSGSSLFLRTSVVARCVQCSSTFNVTAPNTTLAQNITIGGVPIQYHAEYAKSAKVCGAFTSGTQNISVKVSYNKTGDSFGYLDYLELRARRLLKIDGNQLFFRDFSAAGAGNIAEYFLGDYSNNYIIWDVTYPTNVGQISGQNNGGTFVFKSVNDSIREFVAFNKNLGFLKPVYSKKIANQNLHALPQAEYLIVTHPMFLSHAKELAALHKEVDSLSINVVTTEEVYNEFSSGMADATAIKDFVKMFYDRATNSDLLPKYLLLFGDGSYDNKTNTPSNTNLIPTYQSDNSLTPTQSYVSEDYFGLLDDNESDAETDILDIGIGRLPVKNVKEAEGILNKLKAYLKPSSFLNVQSNTSGCCIENLNTNYGLGEWRNIITFIADDQDGAIHAAQADAIATLVDTSFKVVNIEKIYIDAFKQEVSAGGQRYPGVNDAINRRIERGALIVNYTGHGGETGWADERILDVPTIQNWTNLNALPLFVTATCEFSRFDDPSRTSAGELVLLNNRGGGIGLLSTTRLVYSNPNYLLNVNFFNHVFDTLSNGRMARLGDIIRLTKTTSAATLNNRNFTLLGDPAIRLAYPSKKVYTTSINNIPITSFTDTIKGLSKVTIKGYIGENDSAKISSFNGLVFPTIYDKKAKFSTLGNDGIGSPKINFNLQKNIVYRGRVSVTNGDFEFSFIVPKDIAYNIDYGKISYYAENGKIDANGYENRFLIGGFNDKAPLDNSGPEIGLFMNDEKFISGGLTNATPSIFAKLFDENGINTVGNGIGHDITAVLDGNTEKTIVLNDYYQAEINSYQRGTVRYKLNELSEGKHNVKLKAWDVYNNSNETSIDFVVAKDAALALQHVLNYPNPFTTRTQFYFEHNKPGSYLAINIQIFTVSGKLIKTIESNMFNNSYRSDGIEWDGRDDFGDKIARGVYIYKLQVRASDGSYADKIEKLVILQ